MNSSDDDILFDPHGRPFEPESEPEPDLEPEIVDALGVEMSVSNPGVAQALRGQDAQGAEASPERAAINDPDAIRRLRAEAAQAVPDVLMAVPTVRDAEEARLRASLRRDAEIAGIALGFRIEPDGAWRAADGAIMAVRTVSAVGTPASAADILIKLAAVLERGGGPREALIVTAEQHQADLIAAAVLTRDSRCRFRVTSIDTLRELVRLLDDDAVDEQISQALLMPSSQLDPSRLIAALQPLFRRV